MRYRRLPHLVSAVQVRAIDGCEAVFGGGGADTDWLEEALAKNIGEPGGIWVVNDGLRIGTLEGTLHLSVGDYIVQGTHGEIYPVREDIFHTSFEPNGH